MMRSFPWQYRAVPGGGPGVVTVDPAAGEMPGGRPSASYKVTPGARTSPMGSALYLPPIKAQLDRTLPPEFWRGQAGGPD